MQGQINNCDKFLGNVGSEDFMPPDNCVFTDHIPHVYCSFSVVHINAGSALLAENISFDAAVVSETWLKGFESANYIIHGYTFLSACRNDGRRGGGLGMYVHTSCSIISSVVWFSVNGNIQAVKVHISRQGFTGYLVSVYNNHQK